VQDQEGGRNRLIRGRKKKSPRARNAGPERSQSWLDPSKKPMLVNYCDVGSGATSDRSSCVDAEGSSSSLEEKGYSHFLVFEKERAPCARLVRKCCG